jgi:peptide/nickel transport system permease protein
MRALVDSWRSFATWMRLLLSNRTVAVGFVMFIIIVLAALLAPWLSPHSPTRLSIASRLKPPSMDHLLGTDDLGRDLFARLLHAGRTSVLVSLLVVVLAVSLGVVLGVVAGFFKRLDAPIARLTDAMMAFPDVLLAISLVAALGPSTTNVVIALGIVYAPRVARVVRASTLVIRQLPYVEAARALGVSTPRIVTRHVLRNLMSPILVQATFIFANAMLAEAGLSFLGVGTSPEIPTWGSMISEARTYADQAPWVLISPGLAVIAAVLSLQLLGDGLRDILDPKLRKDI